MEGRSPLYGSAQPLLRPPPPPPLDCCRLCVAHRCSIAGEYSAVRKQPE